MELSQCPAGCVLHHQKRGLLLHAVVQQTNDARVREPDQRARLVEKAGACFRCQWRREYLDGSLASQVDLLAQIDVRKPSTPQEAREAIIPKLLTDKIDHITASFLVKTIVETRRKGKRGRWSTASRVSNFRHDPSCGCPPLPKQAARIFLDEPCRE